MHRRDAGRAADEDDLVDLPGSYGTCISVLDPDDTDTVFIDNAQPGSGEGFFYLRSVIDGLGDERGLGATSAGLGRQVAVPCP